MNTIMEMGQYHVQIYSWFKMIFRTSLNIQGHLEVNVCNLVPIALFPDFRGGAHLI